ncbi:MAG TPA: hypothetical protein VJZ00_06410, partial [Thermoanaerobaculia bacterium]|nr:hypothetical protein [Thermoanaerobaculia bacterium]
MKRAVAIVVAFVIAFAAHADNVVNVRVHESFRMQVFGATAAYAVDANVADATAQNGVVTIFARGAGRTKVVVVSVTGQSEVEVRVEPSKDANAPRAAIGGTNGRVESRIETGVPQVHTTVDLSRQQNEKRTEVHVETVHFREHVGQRAETTLPSASYRIFTRGRELTFLDRFVDHSPLTLSSTAIRGVHYVDDRWSAHIGYTAYASYQAFLLPAERDFVAGAAYSIPLSRSAKLTPGVFVFENGTAGSLLWSRERDGLETSAELGVSRMLAGAVKVALDRPHDRLRVDVRYRPSDFPGIDFGQPRGFNADAVWSRTFTRGSVDSAFSASDFDLPGLHQRTLTATSNARLALTKSLSLLGGGSYGRFGDTSSITIPLGLQFDRPRYGVTAIGRWSESSATNRGGPGFRISTRASLGRVFATAYVDYQQQAPTLSLIFREQPDLALALEQLGITATTPNDIARALRDNSALIALGYIDGVTIELAPERTQGGLEMAWLGAGASRMQVRGRLLFNRNETVSGRTDTIIASLSASRRLTPSTDVFASYSYWQTRRRGEQATTQPSLEVGVRHQFDDVPSLFGSNGTISGAVYLDEDVDGNPEGGIAGAEVELDGAK